MPTKTNNTRSIYYRKRCLPQFCHSSRNRCSGICLDMPEKPNGMVGHCLKYRPVSHLLPNMKNVFGGGFRAKFTIIDTDPTLKQEALVLNGKPMVCKNKRQ